MHKNTEYVRIQRAKYKSLGKCYCGRERENEKYAQCSRCRESNKLHSPAKIAKHRAWEIANPIEAKANRRRHNLSRNYKLTPIQFAAMLESQGGVCAICKGPPTDKRGYHVDHNHETNQVRDLLCGKCNSAIGFVDEDVGRLGAMARYLIKHNTCDTDSGEPCVIAMHD